MTPTAIYLADENCLQEISQMEEPTVDKCWREAINDGGNGQYYLARYDTRVRAYNAHLAALRKIPCSPECKGLWADQQKVVENVDYEVKKHCEHNDNCLLSTACISCDDKAFPLVPVREDDLWHKAINLIMAAHDKGLSKEDAVGVVKSQFTITPKH